MECNNSVGLVTKYATKKSDFPPKAKALFGLQDNKKKITKEVKK